MAPRSRPSDSTHGRNGPRKPFRTAAELRQWIVADLEKLEARFKKFVTEKSTRHDLTQNRNSGSPSTPEKPQSESESESE